MKNKCFSVLSAFAVSVLFTTASFASLPEGSYKGNTQFVRKPDVMALLIKQDPANKDVSYAILAEYTRINGRIGPDRLAITKWVPRMYAYRVEKISDLQYAMKPLHVTASGEITANGQASPDHLTLKESGSLMGAVLTRYEKNSVIVAETIKLNGHLGSTWEKYIPGTFFGTTDSTGGDYFGKGVNLVLSEDKVATFSQEKIKGEFAVAEKAPGLFAFTPIKTDNIGNEDVVSRIGVFIDIVNWKPVFTTDELLLINPDNAKDVGFYYERH